MIQELEQDIAIFIKWLENKSTTLGVIDKSVDDRDFTLDDIAAASPIPSFTPYIYNQMLEPACGAHMAAQLINFLNPGVVCSPEYIWSQMRLLDKLPPDYGSDIRTVFKAIQNSGACDLALLPNNTVLSDAQYCSPTNITKPEVVNALPRRITYYGFGTPTTWESLQQTINLYGMIGAQMHIGTGLYTDLSTGQTSWNPTQIFPLQYGTKVDDHFVVLVSTAVAEKFGIINPNPNFVYFVNSWGVKYGQGGLGWMDASYLPYIVEIAACAKSL